MRPASFDRRRGLGLILIVLGCALLLSYFVSHAAPPPARPLTPTATAVINRLIPAASPKTIRTATARVVATRQATSIRATKPAASRTSVPTTAAATKNTRVTATPLEPPPITPTAAAATATTQPVTGSGSRQRFGVGVSLPAPWVKRLTNLNAGWFLDWGSLAPAERPAGLEYVRMVRVSQGLPQPDLATLAGIAQRSPGALWLIGNEPDVIWQDNVTPEQYANVYHDVYATLKQADPASRIAIAGVTQPSPLRLRYLDRILAAYRQQFDADLPVDVWNVHNFILPEKRGDWGVDIPPGLDASSGLIVEVEDHDNLARFKQQIVDFRRWMAERGYRDKELIVSEYGILMYADFGFSYERVRAFMLGTFDYFLTASDDALGLPADGNRLVQRWCWYSLSDPLYPTGNLVDLTTGQLTKLGQDFADYVAAH
jgi:hypothetical protein